MRSFHSLVLLASVASVAAVVLPPLHVIQQASFKYSYSCQPGPLRYTDCALFLTDKSVVTNAPELLYNGACGSNDYFEVMFGATDFGLLTDLGDVPLETLTASMSFNYNNIVGGDNTFSQTVPVVAGHTYAAVLARRNTRALFVFRVESHERNGPVTVRYAVKQFGAIESVQESPGFSWTTPNH